MREVDLLLGPFADRQLSGLEGHGLDAFEDLLSENDQDLLSWLSGTAKCPANHEKLPLLVSLLKEMEGGRMMVFTNTRAAADRVGRTLNANGLQAAVISAIGMLALTLSNFKPTVKFGFLMCPSCWTRRSMIA